MTEQELIDNLKTILADYDTHKEKFQFRKRAENELARLVTPDTKPEDIEALTAILSEYPEFDSVKVTSGDGKNFCCTFYLSCEILKNDPKAIDEFSKFMISLMDR